MYTRVVQWKILHVLQLLDLKTVTAFVIKPFLYCLEQRLSFLDKLCVLLDLQSNLLIKKLTDISLEFLLGYRISGGRIFCFDLKISVFSFVICVDSEKVCSGLG